MGKRMSGFGGHPVPATMNNAPPPPLAPDRFVSTGTIEEKVFQRQLSKEGLQNIVDDKEEVGGCFYCLYAGSMAGMIHDPCSMMHPLGRLQSTEQRLPTTSKLFYLEL